MIIYFADRYLTILASASTSASGRGMSIFGDKKTEEAGVGGANFSCYVVADEGKRHELESCMTPGNYILKKSGDKDEFYTIIDSEYDSFTGEGYIYAEEAGLDLLNEVVLPYEADQAYPIKSYINRFAADSGFEVGINEISDLSRKLKWEGQSTATERILNVATQFDNAEIAFRFTVQGMTVTHKYIDIYKRRGKDTGVALRVDQDVNKIITKKSVANLVTALYVTGGTPEGEKNPITLDGITYDDGRFHLQGPWLKDREANAIWTRYLAKSETGTGTGHLMKTYSYDTTSQTELLNRAIGYLKKASQMEVNYEVEVKNLPDGIEIGDTVRVVDGKGKLYLSARVLKLETSEADKTATVTLGEYLIQESGISDKVEALAAEFAQMARQRARYTWTAYADDSVGTGISLNPEGKTYLGTANNQVELNPDISDPSIYTWVRIKGDQGAAGIPATVYSLKANVPSVTRSASGTYKPSAFQLSGKSQTGNGAPEAISCLYKVEISTSDGLESWVLDDDTGGGSYHNYTIPTDVPGIKGFRCSMYYPDQETLADQIVIPVINEGADGKDAVTYSVQLNASSIVVKKDGTRNPEYLMIGVYKQTGNGSRSFYDCHIKTLRIFQNERNNEQEVTTYGHNTSVDTTSENTGIRVSVYSAEDSSVLLYQTTVYVAAESSDGADSTSYKMLVNATAIAKNASGAYKQSTITVQGRKQTGTGAFTSCACRFKIETTTSTNLSSASWTSRYTSGSNVSSYTYTIPSGVTGIRCSMYLAGGTTTLLDQVIIPIVADGTNGTVMEYSSGSGTRNATYVSSSYLENIYYKYGRVCHYRFVCMAVADVPTNGVTLISGLPPAAGLQYAQIGGILTNGSLGRVNLAVDENGNLKNWYGDGTIKSGSIFKGSITYITAS